MGLPKEVRFRPEPPPPLLDPDDAELSRPPGRPLLEAPARSGRAADWRSIAASLVFHAAIAFGFVQGVEQVLVAGSEESGIAMLGSSSEEQAAAGEPLPEDAVEVTLVTTLAPQEVLDETAETLAAVAPEAERLAPASAAPLATAATEIAAAAPAETLAPVESSAALQPKAEAVVPVEQPQVATPQPAETGRAGTAMPEVLTSRVAAEQSVAPVAAAPAATPAAPAQSLPAAAPAERVAAEEPAAAAPAAPALEAVRPSQAEPAQQPAETAAAAPAAAAPLSAVQPERLAPVEERAAIVAEEVPPPDSPEARAEAAVAALEEVPLPEPRPQETPRAEPEPEPKRIAEAKQPERKAERTAAERRAERKREAAAEAKREAQAEAKRAAAAERTGKTAKTRSGSGGNSERDARRGTATGKQEGRTAASGKGGGGAAGNAAVTNYPGKVRSKLQRALPKRKRGRGEVQVAFTVAANGSVRGARIARSSGSPELDQAALETVHRAAPFPAIPEGAGRSSWAFTIPLQFR